MLNFTSKYTENRWYHIVVTYSPSEQNIYIDGVEVASGSSSHTDTQIVSSQPLRFGSGDNLRPFDGQLDDIAFWTVQLSAVEIQRIYNRQKQKYAGHYDSVVVDLGTTSGVWPGLSWLTNLPFGKELVGDSDNDGSPDFESSADYQSLNGNLGGGLVAYWNMNELDIDTLDSSKDIKDQSANDFHLDLFGGLKIDGEGKFAGGVEFSGMDGEKLSVASAPDLEPSAGSVSMWIKTNLDWGTDGGSTSDSGLLISKWGFGGRPGFGISLRKTGAVQVQASDGLCGSPCNEVAFQSTNFVGKGQWSHVFLTYNTANGSAQNLYVNGQKTTFTASGDWNFDSSDLTIGDYESGSGWYEEFKGYIDDVAFWKRELTESEALAIYRRGANRVYLQVKRCVDSSCNCKSFSASPQGSINDCDGDGISNSDDPDDIHQAEFIGPGGDGATYFSELLNRDVDKITFDCDANTSDSNPDICVDDEILLTGGPKPTSPLFTFDDHLGAPKSLPSRYFQYRVLMEADENGACGGEPCLPELTSVNLNRAGVPKYYGQPQVVTLKKPIAYKKIRSAKVVADPCATFQLSHDGQQFLTWNDATNKWEPSSHMASGVSSEVVANNITEFSAQFGEGHLHLRAFLSSDTNSPCAIERFNIQTSKFLSN